MREPVNSVLAEPHRDLGVIGIDGSSIDSTGACVSALPVTRVRYPKQEKCGIAAAINRSAAEVRPDLVTFLDSHDIWKLRKVESEVASFERYAEVNAVLSDLEKRFLNGTTAGPLPAPRRQWPRPCGNGVAADHADLRAQHLILRREVAISRAPLARDAGVRI